jgi:hypothetical protein
VDWNSFPDFVGHYHDHENIPAAALQVTVRRRQFRRDVCVSESRETLERSKAGIQDPQAGYLSQRPTCSNLCGK